MELSKENQELLEMSIAKGINWNGNPVYQSEPIKAKLLQDQQKIQELEKEKLILQSMVDALNDKIDSLTEDNKQ